VSQDSTADVPEGGVRFGDYEIDCHADGSLCELGRGAMGVTYRATDTSLQRKVALKIIKTDIAERSADARERFVREARAAAALRHEHIATVYQFGMRLETGQYFYAMELIEGETLEDRVHRAGPVDARTTIQIAKQVTSALAAAEKSGLVHRDLKPANLMLVEAAPSPLSSSNDTGTRSWHLPRKSATRARLQVKIIDFGLAKALHTATDPKSLTHDRFVGTPKFASPEQFNHSLLDVRSDIYSLGQTLWFALTGKTPFAGHTLSEIHRAQKSNALPVEQLKAAHVPHRLKSLLGSMLSFEPASRPGTRELAARLQRSSPEVRSVRRTRAALAIATLLGFGLSALFLAHRSRVENSALNPAPEKSIAVLPFENLSADPNNVYFADGVQDEILTRLASLADLRVISRTSVMQYKTGAARDLRKIGQQLGVARVVEGSVQRAGNRVRVNAQLIEVSTNRALWGQSYDRDLADVFAIQSEIARGIAESLQVKLTKREAQALAAKPTNNPEAYDAYLRGLTFDARSAYSNDAQRNAITSYERAVQLDPAFALAWARLSRADAALYFIRADQTAARRDAAGRALENAQELNPNLPETQLALGYYQYWVLRDYGVAKDTFGHLREMLPGSSDILYALGLVTRRQGKWDESIVYLEQCLALDPRNPEVLSNTAWTYAMLRQFSAALKYYDRALEITPNDLDLVTAKAGIYQAVGNLKEAATLLTGINEESPTQPFITKMTQLRLERNHSEAIRLLQARRTRFQFASKSDKATNEVILAFAQRLGSDTTGAQATAGQARDSLEPLCREQPDNSFFAQQLALANAASGEKELALMEAQRACTLLPIANDPLSGPTREEVLALIQMMFGESTRPISTLTRLLQIPYISWLYGPMPATSAVLRLDPIWDPLRADPAFRKLCEEKQ
jgi:serine/threonine protein kinase/Tfp pilus assembly protein PilF